MKNVMQNLVSSVCKAVRGLHEAKGSSLHSIATFVKATAQPGAAVANLRNIRTALRAAQSDRKLQVTDAGRYILPITFGCTKRMVTRKRRTSRMSRKSKSHRSRKSHSRRSCPKRKKSLCKPRCQMQRNKQSRGMKRRKCVRPCTRMWKPKRDSKKSKKCGDAEDITKQSITN